MTAPPAPDSKPARTVLRKPAAAVRPANATPPARPSRATPAAQAQPSNVPYTAYAKQAANTASTQPPSDKKARLRKPRKDDPSFVPPVAKKSAAPAAKVEEGERLSKRVMQLKACSRKEAEQYIESGFVSVNGVVVEVPAHRITNQTVHLDPEASLLTMTDVTLILNKPPGTLDGLEDPEDMEDAPRPAPRGGANRKLPSPNARSLLTPQNHWTQDPSETKVLKRHFNQLDADVELETGASGLVVFTQDWRTTRKLSEDLGLMEHEYLVEVKGEVEPDALKPIAYALKDDRNNLPQVKVSVSSSSPEMSRIRFAIKGSHPGLVAHLCGEAKLEILAMRRVRLGRVTIADLPVGQWRYLADWEKF